MHNHYLDILSRIPELPIWFDENAVPRWCEFSPDAVADIYAREAVLMQIGCQSCGRPFAVAMTRDVFEIDPNMTLEILIKTRELHYGDPPNVDCCDAGPTMNSEPNRVLQYWRKQNFNWVRDPSLEVDICPEWVKDKGAY